jgi:Right handed beta helix region
LGAYLGGSFAAEMGREGPPSGAKPSAMRLLRATMFFGIVASAAVPATAATYVVNNNGNASDSSVGNGVCRTSGSVCTLRAAIQEANATTALDTITFAIGTGPQRITVSSSNLPSITNPVIIDGWTQPGFVDKPLIEIRGSSSLGDGIRITGGTGSVLRGLIVNSFGDDGIQLNGPGGNVVEGCYVGLSADGASNMGNGETGIRIESPNNRIGGKTIPQRNVVSGNHGRDVLGGIFIYGASASGNVVQGNFIGLDATGMFAIGNEARGVAVHDAPGNYIGGVEAGAGNLIAGNRATGVRLWGVADGNYVLSNWIGVNKLKETQIGLYPEPGTLSNARGVQMRSDNNVVAYNHIAGNTYDGVLFYDGTNKDYNPQATGSNNLVYANVITKNGMNPPGPDGPGNGIGVFIGKGNRLVFNSIYENYAYGINLANVEWDDIDLNDLFDADDGTNSKQNYPVLTYATATTLLTRIEGMLHSTPNSTFAVLLYANPACSPRGHGEGLYPLGGVNVTTDASGNAQFVATFDDVVVPPVWAITATAMNANGDTSEFSACTWIQ